MRDPDTQKMIWSLLRKELSQTVPKMHRFCLLTIEIHENLWLKMRTELRQITDIELICRKKVEVEITIFHPTDDDGRPNIAENIVSLRFFATSGGHQEENEWIDWTTLKPLDSIASALAIIPREEIWSIEAGPSELERQAIRNHSCPRCSGKAMLLTDVETEMEPELDAKGNRQYYCLRCHFTFAVDEHGEVVTT